MAKRNERVNQVLRKQRNADKKVSRLEGQGFRIRNTDENPHMKPADIRAMSARELARHERRLDQFTSRNNQYVKGSENVAIPKRLMDRYERVQKVVNAAAEAWNAAIADIKLPGSEDTTIGTLNALRDKLPQGMNKQEKFFQRIDRTAANFTGAGAVREALEHLQKKSSPSAMQDVIERRLNSIRAALTYSGNVDLVDAIDELSLEQKMFMIDDSRFGEIAANDIDSDKYSSDGQLIDAEYEERNGVEPHSETHENLVLTLQWIKENAATANGAARRARGTARKSPKPGKRK